MSFTAPADEWRNTMIFDDVRELELHGFKTTSAVAGVAPLVLTGVRDAWISGAVAPVNSATLAKVGGSQTSNVLISGCDIRDARKMAEIAADVNAGAVRGEFNITKQEAPM